MGDVYQSDEMVTTIEYIPNLNAYQVLSRKPKYIGPIPKRTQQYIHVIIASIVILINAPNKLNRC